MRLQQHHMKILRDFFWILTSVLDQISAHVRLISEMLVAHHFSKISPELEMLDLRVSFDLRFYNVGGPKARSLVHEVQYNYIQIALVYRWRSQKKEKQDITNAKRGKINTKYMQMSWDKIVRKNRQCLEFS